MFELHNPSNVSTGQDANWFIITRSLTYHATDKQEYDTGHTTL